jgi:hypothetical protein
MKDEVITQFVDGSEIRTSPEHLILCWKDETLDWSRQHSLVPGDWVAVNNMNPIQRKEIGPAVFPDGLTEDDHPELAGYSFIKIDKIIRTGDKVCMYDIEVFSNENDHAFIADGVVVHNTGADLNKYAMGLVYQEFKKRGWLDRVKLIITIHDELVFEIEESLLLEATEVIQEIMLKKTIAKLKWRVPLTSDVEFGRDWSVPWNLTKIKYGKDPVPEEVKHLFQKNEVEVKVKVENPSEEPSTPQVASTLTPYSGDFVFRIKKLTRGTADLLSRVISRVNGSGPCVLKIVSIDGEVILHDPNVTVNPEKFKRFLDFYDITKELV